MLSVKGSALFGIGIIIFWGSIGENILRCKATIILEDKVCIFWGGWWKNTCDFGMIVDRRRNGGVRNGKYFIYKCLCTS